MRGSIKQQQLSEDDMSRIVQAVADKFGERAPGKPRAWVQDQKAGHVLSVPCGFAHAVVNVADCIKLAYDVTPAEDYETALLSHAWFASGIFGQYMAGDYDEPVVGALERLGHHRILLDSPVLVKLFGRVGKA